MKAFDRLNKGDKISAVYSGAIAACFMAVTFRSRTRLISDLQPSIDTITM
jgi:hypothetical protein